MNHALRWPASCAVLMLATRATAEPRNTVWLEDIHVEARGETETGFVVEYQAPDLKALEYGHRLLTLRLPAGVAERVEAAPLLRLRQRGNAELVLGEIGFELRGLVFDVPDAPRLLTYGGYANDLGPERDHRLRAGGAGRYDIGRSFVSGDLRFSSALGGNRDASFEAWIGVAAAHGFFAQYELTAALESFAIVPLAGSRISDPVYGQSAGSRSFYYGPALSLRLAPLWTAASVVTGFGVSDAASALLVRWSAGVEH